MIDKAFNLPTTSSLPIISFPQNSGNHNPGYFDYIDADTPKVRKMLSEIKQNREKNIDKESLFNAAYQSAAYIAGENILNYFSIYFSIRIFNLFCNKFIFKKPITTKELAIEFLKIAAFLILIRVASVLNTKFIAERAADNMSKILYFSKDEEEAIAELDKNFKSVYHRKAPGAFQAYRQEIKETSKLVIMSLAAINFIPMLAVRTKVDYHIFRIKKSYMVISMIALSLVQLVLGLTQAIFGKNQKPLTSKEIEEISDSLNTLTHQSKKRKKEIIAQQTNQATKQKITNIATDICQLAISILDKTAFILKNLLAPYLIIDEAVKNLVAMAVSPNDNNSNTAIQTASATQISKTRENSEIYGYADGLNMSHPYVATYLNTIFFHLPRYLGLVKAAEQSQKVKCTVHDGIYIIMVGGTCEIITGFNKKTNDGFLEYETIKINYQEHKIHPGITLIKGKNGAGKSTELKFLTGYSTRAYASNKTSVPQFYLPNDVKDNISYISISTYENYYGGKLEKLFSGKQFLEDITEFGKEYISKSKEKFPNLIRIIKEISEKHQIDNNLSNGQKTVYMLLLAMANGNHLAIDECLSSIAKSSVIPKKNSISEASQEHVEDLENTEASNSDLKEDINDTSELQSNKKTDTKQEKQLREELENLISQYMNKNPEKYCIIVDHNFDLDNIRNLAGQTTENKAQPAVNEEFDIFIATEPDDKNQVTIVGKRLPNTSFAAILDGKKEGIQASQQSL